MPLMFEQFLNVMVGMVDTLMVSKAGEAAVSGVALTTNINLLIIQVMAALATGGAVVCSQYNGRRDTKDAAYAAGQLETVLFIFSWPLLRYRHQPDTDHKWSGRARSHYLPAA